MKFIFMQRMSTFCIVLESECWQTFNKGSTHNAVDF